MKVAFSETISTIDPNIKFLIPEAIIKNSSEIKITILVPALNEEKTIVDFLKWCQEGISKTGVNSEIIIVDSSTDKTAELALLNGAKVVKTPKRGLGRAYIDALEFVSGEFLILGDADCTYDFREINAFYQKYCEGFEFIMGSRRNGYIEKGSMPKLHRYFGIPITNFILNFVYNKKYSDIHSGMRGISLDALKKINITSQKWEYASEMLIKAARLDLKTTEVPIKFYKNRNNRTSVHVREGWLSPWIAGLQNLSEVYTFGSDLILKKLSNLFTLITILYFGYNLFISNTFLNINFHLHWSIGFFAIGSLSILFRLTSEILNIFYNYTFNVLLKINNKRKIIEMTVSSILFIVFSSPLALSYISNDYVLEINYNLSNLFLIGLLFLLNSFNKLTIYFINKFYLKTLVN